MSFCEHGRETCEICCIDYSAEQTEVTRLRSENARLREALEEIANDRVCASFPGCGLECVDVARAALRTGGDQ